MNAIQKNGFDRIPGGDIVGDHIRKGAGADWFRARQPADMGTSYAFLLRMMMAGKSKWEDSKLKTVDANLVITHEMPEDPPFGWNAYTACQMVDQDGLICTFTSHSWGGRDAILALIPEYRMRGQSQYPIVTLSSCPRGNQYGTIDPVFKVVGWTPAEKFDAITGPAPAVLEAPKEAFKRSAADILDDGDDIPFAWAALLLPFAMLVMSNVA